MVRGPSPPLLGPYSQEDIIFSSRFVLSCLWDQRTGVISRAGVSISGSLFPLPLPPPTPSTPTTEQMSLNLAVPLQDKKGGIPLSLHLQRPWLSGRDVCVEVSKTFWLLDALAAGVALLVLRSAHAEEAGG